uniref:PLD phosphodiesterase domain-containing protein n=1 Tax=viral metagenome TaxID=1070528 RepID=A0A6M3JAE4_9ZZZZ
MSQALDLDGFELETCDLEPGDLETEDIDLEGFELEGVETLGEVENRYIRPRHHSLVKARAVKYDRAVDLVRDCGAAILDGERIHVLLSGNFIFGDFIEALLVEFDLFAEDLTLSTLGMSQNNVDSLHNLLDGDYLGSLNLVISDYFWAHNRKNAPYIYEQLDIDNKFQLAVAGTHTKITLLRIRDRKIVITGSANLRSSRCVEEVTIQTDPDLYDFHKDWHDAILTDFATIRKSERASALFDKLTKGSKPREWFLER